MRPEVSVPMTVYNGELYVQDAVASILGQILKAYEFIIIDDGSMDRTPDILDTYDNQRRCACRT